MNEISAFKSHYKKKLSASKYEFDWDENIWSLGRRNIHFYVAVDESYNQIHYRQRNLSLPPNNLELIKCYSIHLLLVRNFTESHCVHQISEIIFILSFKIRDFDKLNPNDNLQIINEKLDYPERVLAKFGAAITSFYSFLFDHKFVSEKFTSIFIIKKKCKNIDDYEKDTSKLPEKDVMEAFFTINKINRERIESGTFTKQDSIDRLLLNVMFLQFVRGARISETVTLKKDCLRMEGSDKCFLHHFVAKKGTYELTPISKLFASELQNVIEEVLSQTEKARKISKQFEDGELLFVRNKIEEYKKEYDKNKSKLVDEYDRYIELREKKINKIFVIPKDWKNYEYLIPAQLNKAFNFKEDYYSSRFLRTKGVKQYKKPKKGVYFKKNDVITILNELKEFHSNFINTNIIYEDFYCPEIDASTSLHFKKFHLKAGYFIKMKDGNFYPGLNGKENKMFISKSKLKDFIVDRGTKHDADGILENDLYDFLSASNLTNIFKNVRVKSKYQKFKEALYKVPFEKIEGALLKYWNRRKNSHRIRVSGKYQDIKLSDSLFVCFLNQFHPELQSNIFPTCLPQSVVSHTFSNGGPNNIFSRYRYINDDGSHFSLVSHQARHWMTTNLYKSGASTAFIDKFQGRTVGQSRLYDNRTGRERGEKLKEMLIEKDILKGDLGDLVQKWKTQEIPINAQKELLNDIVQQVHFTPYGYCTRNLRLNPCEYNVACIKGENGKGCSEFVIDTKDQEALKNIRDLRDNSKNILHKIENSNYKNISNRNIQSHKDMISGCDKAIEIYEQNSVDSLIKPFKKSSETK